MEIKKVEICCKSEDCSGTVYLDVISYRNEKISKYSDLSPYDVTVKKQSAYQEEQISNDAKEEKMRERDIWYPVVDVKTDADMTGVFELSGKGRYQINQETMEVMNQEERCVEIPASKLEHWENVLMTEEKIICRRFYIRKKYIQTNSIFRDELEFLTSNWEGKIILWKTENGQRKELYNKQIKLEARSDSGKRKDRIKALKTTIDYIIRNQIHNPDSVYDQGLYLFYDHDARTFRQPSWVWTWGAAINTLLEAADIPQIAEEYTTGYLYKIADRIGKASLRFQRKDNPSHPAYGMVCCRRDYDLRIKGGYMEFLSPPDSLFLAGWGWMSLYRCTENKEYLEAAKLLVEQTIKLLLKNEDIIEQDYMIPANQWKDWILDEAGFGMKGFAELYESEPDDRYKRWGEFYINQILNCFEREDGLWDRMWTRSSHSLSEISYHTRAMGWAMQGLLSSYQLLSEKKYLDKAVKMADAMLAVQNEEGFWFFQFNEGAEELGISEKGTAYWSGLLYRLYEYTLEPKYFQAAEKALDWCLKNQYVGNDPDGYGGIIGRTPSSGVVYRRFFDISCTYTSAFFGDALTQALKISGGKISGTQERV